MTICSQPHGIGESPYNPQWRRCFDLRAANSEADSIKLVQVSGKSGIAEFEALRAPDALQVPQAFFGVVPIKSGEQVCQQVACGELAALKLKRDALQVAQPVVGHLFHESPRVQRSVPKRYSRPCFCGYRTDADESVNERSRLAFFDRALFPAFSGEISA